MVSHSNQEDSFMSCEYIQSTTLMLVLSMLVLTELLTTNDGTRNYRNIYLTKDASSFKRDIQ